MPGHPGTLAAVVLLFLSACARAEQSPADAGPATGAAESRMVGHLDRRFETAADKFVRLAEAIPEERYDWRPMEGVRSIREVLIHVAADNWAPLWMGVPAPADAPVTQDMASLDAYQAKRHTKEETLAELRRSFAFLRGALEQTGTRLDERVMFGTREWGMDEMWLALATHMHEHLGQVIAYARSNSVVPPWSQPAPE